MSSRTEAKSGSGSWFTPLAPKNKFVNVTLKKTVDWVELEITDFSSLTDRFAREQACKK